MTKLFEKIKLLEILGYTPFCDNPKCGERPRTKLVKNDFVGPYCWKGLGFNLSFILIYKKIWKI